MSRRSKPGNLYDVHTLYETIEQVSILVNQGPRVVMVGEGHKGAEVNGVLILRSGERRGVMRTMKASNKRVSAIEPTVGHMKSDSRLDRTHTQGRAGWRPVRRAVRRRARHATAAGPVAASCCPHTGVDPGRAMSSHKQ